MTHRFALSFALLLPACGWGLGTPVDDALREERTVTPAENEQVCSDSARVHAPPAALLHDDGGCDPETEAFCLRLRPALREVAAAHDAQGALEASARAWDAYLAGDDDAALLARAYADLAVSGRRSWLDFASAPPTPATLAHAASAEACALALERAYDVAWALRGPSATRAELRDELGYVAVSPEDDLPDRPVDVPGAAWPMADVELDVPLGDGRIRTLRTRVVVASTEDLGEAQPPAARRGRLPAPWTFTVPARGDLVVFLHGHSSLAEETGSLADALVARARDRGEALTVLSFDQPSNAYAERIDPSEVLDADGGRDDSLLRFLDRVVLAFVDVVEAASPGARARIRAVAGGSLGGNLVLRLAEVAPPSWPDRFVAWSPASIDFSWSRARWPLAAGDGEFVDVVKHEAVRMTRDAFEQDEDDDSREDYFVGGFTSIRKQAGYWYREGWEPCRSRTIDEGLLQLGEVYDHRYRRWHYRVAFEQLVFSHVEGETDEAPRRFRSIERPLLLVAGEDDDSVPMQTYTFVERLAPHLAMPGTTLFLEDTGHAMHTERPALLAEEIGAFLTE